MMQRFGVLTGVIWGVVVVASGCASFEGGRSARGRVPVIYCTDLFHPHDDPDDHFDLACMYALRGVDLRAVILDQGAKQKEKPGRPAVQQMNALTGRDVPAVIGLAGPLRHPWDDARDQPAEYQGGVERILETLASSEGEVVIVTVGSVRDVVAAWNRRPGLLRRKVRGVYAFIGEASDPMFAEYNVTLDVHAYVGLLRSDLPVFWVPCFDGGPWKNEGRASYWKAPHRKLLASVAEPVMNYFIYALTVRSSDPVAFLGGPVDPQLEERVMTMERNLWCSAVFVTLEGKRIVRDGASYVVIDEDEIDGRTPVFDFVPIRVRVSDAGVVTRVDCGGRRMLQYHVLDCAHYAEAMTAVTARMLGELRPADR